MAHERKPDQNKTKASEELLLEEIKNGKILADLIMRRPNGTNKGSEYEVLHGGPSIHRDTINTNGQVAKTREGKTKLRDRFGFSNTKKGRRKARLPRRQDG